MKILISSLIITLAFAGPLVEIAKRQAATLYALPDGAELIVGSISTSFSCEGKIRGYHADVANKCQIFHICVPSGEKTKIYSFFCGNQTIFDQGLLVCKTPGSASPCDEVTVNAAVQKQRPVLILRWGAS